MPERVNEHLRNAQSLLYEAERRLRERKADGDTLEVLADIAAAVARITRAISATTSALGDDPIVLHPDEVEFAAIVLSRFGPKAWEHANADLKVVWRSEAIKLLQRLAALRRAY